MTDDRDVDVRLAALGAATEVVGPRPGFVARVMDSVSHEPAGWMYQLTQLSWRALPVAATLAVAALVWAARMDGAADEALAVADDAVEVEW